MIPQVFHAFVEGNRGKLPSDRFSGALRKRSCHQVSYYLNLLSLLSNMTTVFSPFCA